MNAAHTPAPWFTAATSHIGHHSIVDSDGCTIADSSPMGEANARLIAAAPKLLDALETVLFAVTKDYDTNGTIDYVAVAMLCRSMIELATGEAP